MLRDPAIADSSWHVPSVDLLLAFPFSRIISFNQYAIVFRSSRTVVPEVYSYDPEESSSSSQGIRGYTYVMATLKFTYFLISQKDYWYVENNSGTSLTGDVFISYDL